jgi:nucleotide-binding universal stress UspA family protein
MAYVLLYITVSVETNTSHDLIIKEKEARMYQKILVPLDGSKRAEMIRPHVRKLASRFQSTVILIMVIEHTYADGIAETQISLSEKVFKAKIKDGESYLDKIASKFRDKGIACKTLIVHGSVVESIIETAKNEEVDLIAMTSHGRGGLSRIFYGSVAAGILNRVDRPLFIVRSRWEE